MRAPLPRPSTAEKLFDRRWALTLLDAVLDHLGQEYHHDDKEIHYQRLKPALIDREQGQGYARIAQELGMSEAAVKKAAQRLRQRYRELLREQIASTVDGAEAIDDEIRTLFTVLGS